MTALSSFIIPLMVFFIIGYAVLKKVDIYDTFVSGAKESFDMILTMFPCLLAMIFGVNLFVNSGIVNTIFDFLKPVFQFIKIPSEVFPMMILRPISGSASLAFLNTILTNYGADSLIGKMCAIIQGSTDTTFYVLTLYFGSIGIKKIKYALYAGLFADLVGIFSAIIITNRLFA